MKNKKKHSSIVVKVLFVIAIIICIIYFLRFFQEKSEMAIKAIPLNTCFFLETNNSALVFNKIISGNQIWNQLTNINDFHKLNKQIHFIDSLSKANTDISEIFEKQNSIISISCENSEVNCLFLVELPKGNRESFVKSIFRSAKLNLNLSLKEKYNSVKIYETTIDKSEKHFHFAVSKGIFIGSSYLPLIKEAINQLHFGKSLENTTSFKKIKTTAGKKVDANIYINLNKFNDLLLIISKTKYDKILNRFSHFADWAELDLLIKSNEILLNGYTISIDSTDQYLSLFIKQQPQETFVTKVLPFNTSFFLNLGISDFNKYFDDYKQYLKSINKLSNFESDILKLNKKYKTNIEKNFRSWIGSEVTLAITGTNPQQIEKNCFTILRSKKSEEAKIFLNELAKISQNKIYIEKYKEFQIGRILIPNLLPLFFGPIFGNSETTYYAIVDDFVVFSSEISDLKSFINNILAGKTLANNVNFKEFSRNTSTNSNIFLYLNIKNAINFLPEFIDNNLLTNFDNNKKYLPDFEAIAVQFSSSKSMFYTNAYLKFNPEYKPEKFSSWKTSLDANIINRPYVIKDHTNNSKKIIVFDEANNMYLIDSDGSIIWKIPIGERIISDVFQVDYFKNNKIQYIFNTENNLYLIDLKGRNVGDYPIKLPKKAMNGIAVFDYENNKNYRIVFAGNDDKIYNYNIKGNSVKGWNKIRTTANVTEPPQHMVANKKDNIFITDKNGKVIIANRKGIKRFTLPNSFKNAVGSKFYENKTNSKGNIVSTDRNGNLTYISSKGNVKFTSFGDFSPDHFFFYEDFDKDGNKDFIFIDKNKLQIFNRFKKPILEYTFDANISKTPVFMSLSKYKSLLGVVSDEKEVIVFDNNGGIFKSSGMIGETPLIINDINGDGKVNIITGKDNFLYNYESGF
ncbi:MAG: DUF3352 domain-containing protein [Bacteroidales bacterium]|nr:DUF3352 domain-containing protein [Bacteroidales bacterium]